MTGRETADLNTTFLNSNETLRRIEMKYKSKEVLGEENQSLSYSTINHTELELIKVSFFISN
jgi:hypothetical protein